MSNSRKTAFWCPILIGLALIVYGFSIQIPGGALTTFSSLNGETTTYYEFDNRYSTIDEYVGGDAYNYIIGACLVAGKTAGSMAMKAIYISTGLLSMGFGVAVMMTQEKKSMAYQTISKQGNEEATIGERVSEPINKS